MKTTCRCDMRSTEPSTNPSGAQRAIRVVKWVVPSIVLAALPKCPVCVAAYVTLFTGCSISLATASSARWLVQTACVGILLCLGVKTVFKLRRPNDGQF
jgi:hypothetical protein